MPKLSRRLAPTVAAALGSEWSSWMRKLPPMARGLGAVVAAYSLLHVDVVPAPVPMHRALNSGVLLLGLLWLAHWMLPPLFIQDGDGVRKDRQNLPAVRNKVLGLLNAGVLIGAYWLLVAVLVDR